MTLKIIAMGGGGFSMEPDEPALDCYILTQTAAAMPRVCFVPTASGDAREYIARFYDAFGALDCEPCHLDLFRRGDRLQDLREADVVYVGGGNTANMLAIWRLHGVDTALREAAARGVVLAGLSAGSLCWFEEGVSDSFGPALAPLHDGLGLLRGSHCPHFDGEPRRRPRYLRLVQTGVLKPGIAVDDGVAVRFSGGRIAEAVASRSGVGAWLVTPGHDAPKLTAIPVRRLP